MKRSLLRAALAFAGLCLFAMPFAWGADVAPRYIVDAGGQQGKGVWQPHSAEAAHAEKALRNFLNGHDDSHLKWPVTKNAESGRQRIAANIDSYILQLVGARQGSGDKIWDFDGAGPQVVMISGFCRTDGTDMSQHLVVVMDGGACFFHALYDPVADAITYFGINGVR